MSKREFGALRQLPSGRWQAKYRHPRTNEFVSAHTTFTMRGDATRWLASVQREIERGTWIDPEWGTVTLRDYATSWLAQRTLRPRTVELYQGLFDRYILAGLGQVELGSLSPREVRAWHVALLKLGRPGPVTVAKAYRLLRTICETAVSDEMIARNPCNLKGAAVEHSPERPVLSVAEVEALAETIEERFGALVLLAAWCGLRLGEALALTRADVGLEEGSVVIDKSAAELKSGERIVGAPKTKAGIRKVYVPPHVVPALRSHLERYTGPEPEDLVFTGTQRQPLRRASLYTAWLRATGQLGLDGVRLHDLRHTGATLAAATGASTKELMNRLGHASSDAALRYQHATQDRDVAIARALSDLASARSDHSEPRQDGQVGQGEAAGLARTRSEAESHSDP
jgi:integrase